MAVEKRRELRSVYPCRRCGWFSDAHELWSGMGMERMSPNAQAVTGIVTGGAILLAAALLILFANLWWLIFIFGWMVFPALGAFARGVVSLVESREKRRLPESYKERELLEALRDRGELTPTQAALATSLTVREADEMLKELAEGGYLQMRVRGGALSYSLWGYEKDEERGNRCVASRAHALTHSVETREEC